MKKKGNRSRKDKS